MSLKRATFLILLTLGPSAFAKNYAVFMGAGGEPKGAKTIFDRQARAMGGFTQKADWQTELTFNGGHSTTEAVLTDTFGKKGITNKPFTEASYNQLIQDYEEKITKGEITNGDQLMLVISTHGAHNNGKEKTHQISVTGGEIEDFNSGAGSITVPMDKLENLTKLAEQKGIKLAIVDLSCHSGNAIPLNNSKTCVVTATGPNHYGYGGDGNAFTNKLLESFQQGKSLEEVFINARKNYDDRSFPMISSPVGLDVNTELYDPLTPYLYNYDEKFDKFSPYITQEAAKGEACKSPEQFQDLMNLIADVESVKKAAKNAKFSSKDARKLRESLKSYYDIMTGLRTNLQSLNLPDLKPREKFCAKYEISGGKVETCIEYSLSEVMTVDLAWLEKHYQTQIAKNDSNKDMMTASLDFIPQIKARREALIAANPDLAKQATFFKDQKDLEQKTTQLANTIADASRALYQSLYRQKASTDTRPNPCKDFIL